MRNITAKLVVALFILLPIKNFAQQDTIQNYEVPTVVVVGAQERLPKIAGSAQVLSGKELRLAKIFNTNEALRKAPGINIREEDGFALRPNIGIRGLNPNRSTKVLLLEDGILLTYAPYGDNASYYHPPVERFSGIEILKGSEQVIFGPQTIGGVINYLTPSVSKDFNGRFSAMGGSDQNLNSSVRLNYMNMLFDLTHKQGNGTRKNEDFLLTDYNYKGIISLATNQKITLRGNFYDEKSTTTYSGLSPLEFARFGYDYNPFKNDKLEFKRIGLSATHLFLISKNVILTTSFYGSNFKRDWWRQSSTTTDAQGGASIRTARLAGLPIDVDTINSVQGRLREYFNYGVEPRLEIMHNLFNLKNELHVGIRLHYEDQYRQQVNGTSPLARVGTTVEDNERFTTAISGFIQNRFMINSFTFTPVIRIENVKNKRVNNLTAASGSISFTEFIPGFGFTYSNSPAFTIFAGIHKGFAPPRTEDLIVTSGRAGDPINITSATFTDVDPERSTVLEIGTRTLFLEGLRLELTLFRNQFQNQIAVGSIAGGSTPLAQGETLYQGMELSGRFDLDNLIGISSNIFLNLNYTFLPEAKQLTEFIQVVDQKVTAGSKAGNRLPYAPKHMLVSSLSFSGIKNSNLIFEAAYVSDQFSDFAETTQETTDGQRGLIRNQVIFNATINYDIPALNLTIFATGKNLANKIYLSDRTRGMRFGSSRLILVGADWKF